MFKIFINVQKKMVSCVHSNVTYSANYFLQIRLRLKIVFFLIFLYDMRNCVLKYYKTDNILFCV